MQSENIENELIFTFDNGKSPKVETEANDR